MKERFLLVRPYYGVNIHTDAQGEFGTVLHSRDVFPDLPLINSATILNGSADHSAVLLDAYVEGKILPDDLLTKITSSKFDKLIIKTAAATIKSDLELARMIKDSVPGSYIMLAGQAVKTLKSWICDNTQVDEVIDEPLDKYIYRYVNGREGTINDMPVPDYSLVDYKSYRDDNDKIRLTVLASRSCPLNCAYCPYIQYYNAYESRDVDKVMEDIRSLVALGVDIIQFRDQFFTCDKERIMDLCRRIISEGIKISWICETELSSLDEELIDLMKEAGLFLVCFDIKSGNKEILGKYKSKNADKAGQKKTVDMIRSKGVKTMAFYTIGFPEDTWITLYETFKLAEYMDSDIVAFNEFTDFHLDGMEDMTPDVFCSFQNAGNSCMKMNLTHDEIRYAIELFSMKYTESHDSVEKAFSYNYTITMDNKNIISKIAECESDLMELSNRVRRIRGLE